MKKSLLLAALLLSSAAQAETWVCSEPTSSGSSYLATYVRQGEEFSITLTIPEDQERKSETLEPKPAEILVETDSMLTLAEIEPDGKSGGITMINKITKQYVFWPLDYDEEISRGTGVCVRI